MQRPSGSARCSDCLGPVADRLQLQVVHHRCRHEVEATVDGEALQEELEPTLIKESDQEVQEMIQEEEVGSRKTSREEEINDSRRFEGKLSRQQELRQSENNEVERHISIFHLYNSLFRCQSCGPAWTPRVRRWD